jgi:hypothetical protein
MKTLLPFLLFGLLAVPAKAAEPYDQLPPASEGKACCRGPTQFRVFRGLFSIASRSFRKRAYCERSRSMRRNMLPALSWWLSPKAEDISRRVDAV